MKTLLSTLALLISSALSAQVNTHIAITSLPPYHADGSAVYAAGSFNGWNPQDEQYRFNRDGKGNYFLDLKLEPGVYEYKITRGGWDKVECEANGTGTGNRRITVPVENSKLAIAVAEWADRFPAKPRASTNSKQVQVIDTAFWIPQLKRTRRISVYLPESYGTGHEKKYPVLYMHDGQNLFDDATSFSGEWGVDEFFDSTALPKAIVVAIDHGDGKRLNEYNPYDNARFGKGEGDAYADFIVKTLKPYIDKHYRTIKNAANTFISGSSMGGLISFYTILKYPKTFGGAGIFSPSFWITGAKIDESIKAKGEKFKGKLYFYCGKLEGDNMVTDMLKVFERMAAVSKAKMTTVIRDDGKHSEASWRKEFPLFYQWISR